MKKSIYIFLLSSFAFSSTSCFKENLQIKNITISKNIYAGAGDIRCIGDDFVIPFNTSISMNVYYLNSELNNDDLNKIEDDLSSKFIYLHALSDNRNDYFDYSENNEGERIKNIKYINENRKEPIKVDPLLFDMLKRSYEFTIYSNCKFNIFNGALYSLYEHKLDNLSDNYSSLSYSYSLLTNRVFSSFSQDENNKIENIVSTFENVNYDTLMSFDETNYTVTFNSDDKNLEISLGGCAKGYACEYVSNYIKNEYQDIAFVLNSGYSSIKALGKRKDNKNWRIRYTNPYYFELIDTTKIPANAYETILEYNGDFNVSTSGFYNQYFYEFKDNQFLRRNHIVDSITGYSNNFYDQVSVFLDDSFLADMYSTALMNTTSEEECLTLFNNLNSIYEENNSSLILVKKINDDSSLYTLSLDDFSNLSNNNKPMVKLKNGSIEEINDEIKIEDIESITSTYSATFKMEYKVSESLFSSFSLLDDVSYKESVKAVIKKL